MINVQGWWQPSQGDVGAAGVNGKEDRAVRRGGRGGGSRQLLVFVLFVFVFVFIFVFCVYWGQELGEICGSQRGEGWVGEKEDYLI